MLTLKGEQKNKTAVKAFHGGQTCFTLARVKSRAASRGVVTCRLSHQQAAMRCSNLAELALTNLIGWLQRRRIYFNGCIYTQHMMRSDICSLHLSWQWAAAVQRPGEADPDLHQRLWLRALTEY